MPYATPAASAQSGSHGPQALSGSLQPPFDAAVVIPTVLRDSLMRAVRSVFSQEHPGRIQILIGIDVARGDREMLRQLAAECPDRMALTVVDLGYSTARVHGGVYHCSYGGSLRTILSYAANSPRLAYLDDDNWYAPHHIGDLLATIEGFDWAFTYRWYVDPGTQEVMCVDDFESIGPGRGIYGEKLGGFVDTNCVMIDKTRCHWVLPFWSIPLLPDGTGTDRNVFDALRTKHSVAWNRRPTVYYVINPEAGPQPVRERILAQRGLKTTTPPKGQGRLLAHRDARINEYLLSTLVRKLHVGAGPNVLPGWLNTDIAPQSKDVLALDCAQPLPFADQTFDYIAGEHVIEHMPMTAAIRFLKEAFRILRPGGKLRLATPDLTQLVGLYANNPSELQRGYVDWITRTFLRGVSGYNPALVFNNLFYNFGHRCIYDRQLLVAAVRSAGFVDPRFCAPKDSTDPALQGIERHGDIVGAPEYDAYETMVLEVARPPRDVA